MTGRTTLTCAHGGSGKILAMLIAIRARLEAAAGDGKPETGRAPSVLVLTSTVEKGCAIEEKFRKFAGRSPLKAFAAGMGQDYARRRRIIHGVDLVAGPAAFIEKAVELGLDLSAIEQIWICEAGELIVDPDSREYLLKFLSQFPEAVRRNVSMLSDEWSEALEAVVKEHFPGLEFVRIGAAHRPPRVLERFELGSKFQKTGRLFSAVAALPPKARFAIVCDRKRADRFCDEMLKRGIVAQVFTGDLTEVAAKARFRNTGCRCAVFHEVARGLFPQGFFDAVFVVTPPQSAEILEDLAALADFEPSKERCRGGRITVYFAYEQVDGYLSLKTQLGHDRWKLYNNPENKPHDIDPAELETIDELRAREKEQDAWARARAEQDDSGLSPEMLSLISLAGLVPETPEPAEKKASKLGRPRRTAFRIAKAYPGRPRKRAAAADAAAPAPENPVDVPVQAAEETVPGTDDIFIVVPEEPAAVVNEPAAEAAQVSEPVAAEEDSAETAVPDAPAEEPAPETRAEEATEVSAGPGEVPDESPAEESEDASEEAFDEESGYDESEEDSEEDYDSEDEEDADEYESGEDSEDAGDYDEESDEDEAYETEDDESVGASDEYENDFEEEPDEEDESDEIVEEAPKRRTLTIRSGYVPREEDAPSVTITEPLSSNTVELRAAQARMRREARGREHLTHQMFGRRGTMKRPKKKNQAQPELEGILAANPGGRLPGEKSGQKKKKPSQNAQKNQKNQKNAKYQKNRQQQGGQQQRRQPKRRNLEEPPRIGAGGESLGMSEALTVPSVTDAAGLPGQEQRPNGQQKKRRDNWNNNQKRKSKDWQKRGKKPRAQDGKPAEAKDVSAQAAAPETAPVAAPASVPAVSAAPAVPQAAPQPPVTNAAPVSSGEGAPQGQKDAGKPEGQKPARKKNQQRRDRKPFQKKRDRRPAGPDQQPQSAAPRDWDDLPDDNFGNSIHYQPKQQKRPAMPWQQTDAYGADRPQTLSFAQTMPGDAPRPSYLTGATAGGMPGMKEGGQRKKFNRQKNKGGSFHGQNRNGQKKSGGFRPPKKPAGE